MVRFLFCFFGNCETYVLNEYVVHILLNLYNVMIENRSFTNIDYIVINHLPNVWMGFWSVAIYMGMGYNETDIIYIVQVCFLDMHLI